MAVVTQTQFPFGYTRNRQSGSSLCILSFTFPLKILKVITGSYCLTVGLDSSARHTGASGLIYAYFIMVVTIVSVLVTDENHLELVTNSRHQNFGETVETCRFSIGDCYTQARLTMADLSPVNNAGTHFPGC